MYTVRVIPRCRATGRPVVVRLELRWLHSTIQQVPSAHQCIGNAREDLWSLNRNNSSYRAKHSTAIPTQHTKNTAHTLPVVLRYGTSCPVQLSNTSRATTSHAPRLTLQAATSSATNPAGHPGGPWPGTGQEAVHEPPSVAYVCEMAGVPGKFDPSRAAALGVPRGPVGLGMAWVRVG